MPQLDTVVVGLIVLLVAIVTPMGLHTVAEGHVGVYYRAGKLLHSVSSPGFRLKVPFLTFVHEVQTTLQVDLVQNIPCGTSGGVMIYFDKIEVVNQLSRDLVYETVRNYTVNYDKTCM